MTPNELRALADALEPMARAPRFEDFDVPAFCAWLRAQAEAEPVAWIVEHGPTRRLTFFDEAPGKVGSGVSIPLSPHPAPAAPQAEPCIGNDSACPCQDGDACHYKDAADGTKAWPALRMNSDQLRELADILDGERSGLFLHHECRAASEPTETEIEARDALLDFISENGTASEGVQHYLDRYVRAALAAKE